MPLRGVRGKGPRRQAPRLGKADSALAVPATAAAIRTESSREKI
jgi:hypothetical protein